MAKKILCVGIVTVDIITRPVEKMPEPGLLTPVDSISMHVGGCAANAACDLRRLGFDPLLTVRTGDDGFAAFVRRYLEENGVDLRYVVTDRAHETAATTVVVSASGERTFLHNPGANDALTASDVPDAALDASDIVFVAGTFLMHGFDGEECRRLLLRARKKGKFTCLDTAWDFRGGWMQTLAPCLSLLDLFMPSYDEASALAGGEKDLDKMADFFFGAGAKNVVIKCGREGAYICEAGRPRFMAPAYPVLHPADTTGAGDAFCAGFLAGLAMEKRFADCAKLGNAVGHFCVTGVGASSGVPSLAAVEAFLKTAEK